MPARITYKAGEEVSVFYRCGDSDSYMPVSSFIQGLKTPRVGQTHGWVPAVVTDDFDTHKGDKDVKLRYSHEKWVDRHGEPLNIEDPRNMHAIHPFHRVRKARNPQGLYLDDNGSGLARLEVALSVVMVRWSDENCDEVKEGDSGWGPTGAVVSDSNINIWLEAIDCAFPCDYQVMTVWVASSEDMANVAQVAVHLRPSLHGRHLAGFYYLWPCQSLDAQHIPSGYVDLPAVMSAMTSIEAAGIPTRFPHSSHLYKVFLSKDWTSQLCLDPEMRIPATTKVSRWMVERDPLRAARHAIAALGKIVEAHDRKAKLLQAVGGAPAAAASSAPNPPAAAAAAGSAAATAASTSLALASSLSGVGFQGPARGDSRDCLASSPDPAVRARSRGVAKLGYSWEANDVLKYSGEGELAVRLNRLFHQAQGTPEFAFVQDLIEDFDCEVRTFVINGTPVRHARRYTQFAVPVEVDGEEGREAGRYTCFERGGRDMALHKWMYGNDAALKDAEAKVDALIAKYVLWLSTECCECPPVFRFDAFLRIRTSVPAPGGAPGSKATSPVCDVFSGELTELGACTLGWELSDMVSHLFPAVLGSCLDDKLCRHPACPCKRPLAPAPPQQQQQQHQQQQGGGGGASGAEAVAPFIPGVTCCGGAPGRDRRCNVAPFARDLKRRSDAEEARLKRLEGSGGNGGGAADDDGGGGEDDDNGGGHWSSGGGGGGNDGAFDDVEDDDDEDGEEDDDEDEDDEEEDQGNGEEGGGSGCGEAAAVRAANSAVAAGGSASAAAAAAEQAAAKASNAAAKKKLKRIRAKNNKAKDKRKKRGSGGGGGGAAAATASGNGDGGGGGGALQMA